ncbi:MAG: tRNA dihydrouridine synthase [Opitutales bacterium]
MITHPTVSDSTLPWFGEDRFPLYLAPMAGFTDVVYRDLCKRCGADVLVSEFVLADSLVYGNETIWEHVDFSEDQRPMGAQIFGSSPEIMAQAGQLLVERLNPDFIDLNFGCPSDKVACKGAGSSLLKEPARLEAIAAAVVNALAGTPVTGKIRVGWDRSSIVCEDVTRRLENAGVRAVAIHGRTKTQGYSGEPDWDEIEAAARAVTIPVVGNGNVRTSEDVERIRGATSVSGLMIGRAALGYPWLFGEIKHFLRTGHHPLPPTLAERWETLLTYARLLRARPLRQHKGPHLRWMKPKLVKLTKGMAGCKAARQAIQRLDSLEALEAYALHHQAAFQPVDDHERALLIERRRAATPEAAVVAAPLAPA